MYESFVRYKFWVAAKHSAGVTNVSAIVLSRLSSESVYKQKCFEHYRGEFLGLRLTRIVFCSYSNKTAENYLEEAAQHGPNPKIPVDQGDRVEIFL